MVNHRLGEIDVSNLPRVVGTISCHSSLPLSYSVSPRRDFICDIVEVRLDEVGTNVPNWLQNCQSLEGEGFPTILTIRQPDDGGKWTGGDEARESMFSDALDNLSTIDIECGSKLVDDLCASAESQGKSLIISYHNFQKTPELQEMQGIVSEILSHPCAIPKIAAMVTDDKDIRTLRSLLEENSHKPLCVIGMGASGTSTRTAFPHMGSCLTYGYLDRSSAPGQMACAELVHHLRRVLPKYNEDLITRKELLEFA